MNYMIFILILSNDKVDIIKFKCDKWCIWFTKMILRQEYDLVWDI